MAAGFEDWDAPPAGGEPELVVDVEGFEGPLDLLLHLARRQKVDLSRISVLALCEQYLLFVEEAKSLRLELAADYLVTAAWLAFLKSKLLLPVKAEAEAESGEEMAAALQFRLRRLEAMREAGRRLMEGRQLGRDTFARGMPEAIRLQKRPVFSASLHDLLSAYVGRRQMGSEASLEIAERPVWSLAEGRTLIERMLEPAGEWMSLDRILADGVAGETERTAAIASSFAASLELVREGSLEMQQDEAFAPLFLRATPSAGPALRVVR